MQFNFSPLQKRLQEAIEDTINRFLDDHERDDYIQAICLTYSLEDAKFDFDFCISYSPNWHEWYDTDYSYIAELYPEKQPELQAEYIKFFHSEFNTPKRAIHFYNMIVDTLQKISYSRLYLHANCILWVDDSDHNYEGKEYKISRNVKK